MEERNRRAGRALQVGQFAMTDYQAPGPLLRVRIVERCDGVLVSQSGISFRVEPAMKNGDLYTWYDADWFWPA